MKKKDPPTSSPYWKKFFKSEFKAIVLMITLPAENRKKVETTWAQRDLSKLLLQSLSRWRGSEKIQLRWLGKRLKRIDTWTNPP
jgi:hypothetical protein